jgi:23S rRNA pseudouridine2605 synthase
VLVPTPEFDPDILPRVVQFNDQPVAFEKIQSAGGEGTNRWFHVEAAHSHRRAAVRALFETQGLKVSRVIQVRFADQELPRGLPRGKHQALSDQEVARLYESAELTQPVVERVAVRAPRRAADRRKAPKPTSRPAARERNERKPDSGTTKKSTKPRSASPARGGRKPTGSRRSGR